MSQGSNKKSFSFFVFEFSECSTMNMYDLFIMERLLFKNRIHNCIGRVIQLYKKDRWKQQDTNGRIVGDFFL